MNTIRKVPIVVKLFTTNCQWVEKLKRGPLTPQTPMIVSATMNAHGVPTIRATRSANLRNRAFMVSVPLWIGISIVARGVCDRFRLPADVDHPRAPRLI